MSSVTLTNVRKTYPGDVVAVHDFSLEIRDREFVVLVGPSGCGKSTTLRMIAGLESVSGGEIRIGDRVVNDVPAKDREIAMVFQNYALYPHMTVAENMSFALRLKGVPRAEIKARVEETADLLGIRGCLDRRPSQLSGGLRQRVAVGRTIVRRPKVFLFDEPLSNLDAKMRVQMRVEIRRLHQRLDATMIYVTHDQTEAMTMGDRVVVMEDGHIRQAAEPLEVYRRPADLFTAGFIGTPSMNFFRGTVVPSGAGAPVFRTDGLDIPLPDGWRAAAMPLAGVPGCTLGVRPEDVFPPPDPAAALFSAPLQAVESMGAETYLYGGLSGLDSSFVARVPGHIPYRAGETVPFAFRMDNAHLFDGSGAAVR